MLDFANVMLGHCWEICYERNLTREELAKADIPDTKILKMEACARKCVNREFEVLRLMNESRSAQEREEMSMMSGQQ